MVVLRNKFSNSEKHYIDSGINMVFLMSQYSGKHKILKSVFIELELTRSNELWKSDAYRLYAGCSSLHPAYLQPVDQSDNRFILLYFRD